MSVLLIRLVDTAAVASEMHSLPLAIGTARPAFNDNKSYYGLSCFQQSERVNNVYLRFRTSIKYNNIAGDRKVVLEVQTTRGHG